VKFDLVLLTRIFVGSLLGCVIGWEREVRGSAAGDRTFGLVSGRGQVRVPAKAAKTPNKHRILPVGATMGKSCGSVYVIDVTGIAVEPHPRGGLSHNKRCVRVPSSYATKPSW
jgi:hypothetical protein